MTTFIVYDRFFQKWYLWFKTEKMKIFIEFYIYEFVYVPNLAQKEKTDFMDKHCPKRTFSVKNSASEHYH